MPRGTPLTPEQTEQIAALWQKTGNLHEVARQLGLGVSTVHEVLLRRQDERRRTLHTRALERGEQRGRELVAKNLERVERLLEVCVDTPLLNERPPEMEPGDIAKLVVAQSQQLKALSAVRVANAKLEGLLPPEVVEVKVSPRVEIARRIAELAARAEPADDPGGADGDGG